MRTAGRQGSTQRAKRATRNAALAGSIVPGAYAMALAIGSGSPAWLGWFSLVPLFLAIRLWPPAAAALAGASWGLCLFLFSATQPDVPIATTLGSVFLLAAIPATYTWAGAWLSRRIGFNPLLLGFAWIAVELALGPVGLRTGLLGGGGQESGTLLHWVSGALGYVLVAFLIAAATASVISVLSVARWPTPPRRYCTPLDDGGAVLWPQTSFCFPLLASHPARPRAPPIVY